MQVRASISFGSVWPVMEKDRKRFNHGISAVTFVFHFGDPIEKGGGCLK